MFRKLIPSLTEEESIILKGYMQAGQVPQGCVLMEMGKDEQDLYFIISGQYDIYQKVSLANNSSSVLHLASLEGLNLIGEINLFLSEARSASILTRTECKYFKLHHNKLEALLAEHPQIAAKIYQHAGQTVAKRLRTMQENIYNKMVETSETTHEALKHMNKFVGPTKICSLRLSEKLFPTCYQKPVKIGWKVHFNAVCPSNVFPCGSI